MRKFASIALVGLAIVLAVASPGLAEPRHGGGHGGGFARGHFESHGHFVAPRRFEGHHGFVGPHHFVRRGPFIGVAPFFSVYPPVGVYAAPAPTYWYCPSYGAYYPDVPSCPEPWVPVGG